MPKKLFALMLLSALLLTACSTQASQSGSVDETTSYTSAETKAEETTAEEFYYSASIPEGLDYGGDVFTIYTFPGADSGDYWADIDFSATEETGEILNDTVYSRMRFTEEKLNVKIETYAAALKDGSILKSSVLADDGAFDVAFVAAQSADSLAQNGIIMNIKNVGTLDLDAAWWDQNAISGLSIANKVYLLTGDISIMPKRSIRAIYFNKTLAQNYNIDDPYALVADMKWTIDNMGEMVRQVSVDLNGDSKMDANDCYGLLYKDNSIYTMLIGAGVISADKD